MATRKEVYEALETEDAYQVRHWAGAGRNHEIASWITYMRSYLEEAANIASRSAPETPALEQIRKVTEMGIQCMIEHGAPRRPDAQKEG